MYNCGLFDIGKLLLDSKLQSINCSYPFEIVGLPTKTNYFQLISAVFKLHNEMMSMVNTVTPLRNTLEKEIRVVPH